MRSIPRLRAALAAVVTAYALTGCATGLPAPLPPIVRSVSVAAPGSVEVALAFDAEGRGLLATRPEWVSIQAELRPVRVGTPREPLRQRLTRNGSTAPRFSFKGVGAGTWELRLQLLDGADDVLWSARQEVSLSAGQSQRLAVRVTFGSDAGRVGLPETVPARGELGPSAPAGLTDPSPTTVGPGPVLAQDRPATPGPSGVSPLPPPSPVPSLPAGSIQSPVPVGAPSLGPSLASGTAAVGSPEPTSTPPVVQPTSAPSELPLESPRPSVTPRPLTIPELLAAGQRLDLIAAPQALALTAFLPRMAASSRQALDGLLTAAGSDQERILVLKAASVGNVDAALAEYAQAIRQQPASWVESVSTMRDDLDLVQQWEDACGPALVQTALGELDPRYAWQLNGAYQLARVDERGVNQGLAAQQKAWLEAYTGVAVPRGASGGRGIGITQLLNDKLSPLSRATYAPVAVSEPRAALATVAEALRAGFDVPLRLAWDTAGTRAHFVLAIAVAGQPGALRFQVHDTFSGKTAWVDEAQFVARRLQPIFGPGQQASFTHWYRPTPMDP